MSKMKKRFYRVELIGDGAFYIESEDGIGNIVDMLRECDNGCGYSITVVFMTQEHYDGLPEFRGF